MGGRGRYVFQFTVQGGSRFEPPRQPGEQHCLALQRESIFELGVRALMRVHPYRVHLYAEQVEEATADEAQAGLRRRSGDTRHSDAPVCGRTV